MSIPFKGTGPFALEHGITVRVGEMEWMRKTSGVTLTEQTFQSALAGSCRPAWDPGLAFRIHHLSFS